MTLSQQEKEVIDDALRKKEALLPCAACGGIAFVQADEVAHIFLLPNINHLIRTSLPTAAIICANCGLVRFHALGILGLMPFGKRVSG